MKIRKLVFLFLCILWIVLVFLMSNQDGTKSGGISDKIVDAIIKIFIKDFNEFNFTKKNEIHNALSLMVRKLAHFNEFGIFSLFVYFSFFEKKNMTRVLCALILTLALAVSDEIHQLFIEGRAGAFIDVIIDFSGALFYTSILSLIFGRYHEKKGNS